MQNDKAIRSEELNIDPVAIWEIINKQYPGSLLLIKLSGEQNSSGSISIKSDNDLGRIVIETSYSG